jgi:cytoskeletal protein CcmA (bactofilin family)
MDETTTRSWKKLRPSDTRAEAADSGGAEVTTSQPAKSVSGTFIGSGAVFEGTLTLKGDFRIDTEFRGELTTDGTVVVGRGGSVEGNISARQVEIQGAVVGDVTARRLFILRAGGHLHGDIETACLEIERHAFLRGRTKMTRPHADSLARDTGVNDSPQGRSTSPGQTAVP